MSDAREKAIRDRAYALWEKSGSAHGQHGEHWDQAVAEIDADSKPVKGKPGGKANVAVAAVEKRKPGPKPKAATVSAPVPKPVPAAAPKPVAKAKPFAAKTPAAAAKGAAAPAPKAKADPAPVSVPARAVGKAKQAAESVVATVKRATKGAAKK